jgi:hypothetical protein
MVETTADSLCDNTTGTTTKGGGGDRIHFGFDGFQAAGEGKSE